MFACQKGTLPTTTVTTTPRQVKRSVRVYFWLPVCVAPPARQLICPTPPPGQLLRRQTVIPEHLLCPSAAGPVPAVFLVATPLPSIPPSPACAPSSVARHTHDSARSHTVRGELLSQRRRRHRPQTQRSTRPESRRIGLTPAQA